MARQSDGQKFELFSPEWIQFAKRHLEQRVAEAGERLEGIRFEICEVLTDPPAHLARGGSNRLSWNLVFNGPTVQVSMGEIDCALKIVGDYQKVLPSARTLYGDSPEALAANRERLTRLGVPAIPGPLRPVLLDLHDVMARRTA
ncbi:MAG: hypothetical protein JSR66_25365 [Proteobacteria bacterium]|nr:hypothetical protein [Pseudomonadota bacterium]